MTVATDGFDRYPSVLADLSRRNGEIDYREWFETIFRGGDNRDILDVRGREQKERLFRAKEEVWKQFQYSKTYGMQSQSFWDAEYEKIAAIDEGLLKARN